MANQDAAGVDTNEDYSKMKVVELKKLLKDRGLPLSGTKDELIERLRQANEAAEKKLLEESAVDESQPVPEELEDEIMNDENKVTSTGAKAGDKRKLAENGKADISKKGAAGENKENKTGDAALTGDQKSDSTEPSKKVIKLSAITPEEKKELRAKKFGLTEEEKKEARAKRFGITPQVKTNSAKPALTTVKKSIVKDDALMKKRAERFGILGDTKLTPEELEKRKKRAERFGVNAQEKEAKVEVEVKEK